MKTGYIILAIAVSTAVTFALRALPFAAFCGDRAMPAWLERLGRTLPSAIMAVLVVYCLKDVTTTFADTGLWQVIAALATGICYKCSHNTFVSIVLGTACYMLLLRLQI